GEVVQGFLGMAGGAQDLTRLGEKGLPLGGQLDPAADPVEQPHRRPPFQRRDGRTDRRLGQAQSLGGTGEMQALGHGGEDAQLLQGHRSIFLMETTETMRWINDSRTGTLRPSNTGEPLTRLASLPLAGMVFNQGFIMENAAAVTQPVPALPAAPALPSRVLALLPGLALSAGLTAGALMIRKLPGLSN